MHGTQYRYGPPSNMSAETSAVADRTIQLDGNSTYALLRSAILIHRLIFLELSKMAYSHFDKGFHLRFPSSRPASGQEEGRES